MPRLTQALCSLYACIRGLLLLCCSLVCTVVCAQTHDDYPTKTIKMVVLFGPGGTSDLAARFFAQKLEPLLGQQVIVENRAGAGGTIGTMLVKNAPADGYTILVATNTPMTTAAKLHSPVWSKAMMAGNRMPTADPRSGR